MEPATQIQNVGIKVGLPVETVQQGIFTKLINIYKNIVFKIIFFRFGVCCLFVVTTGGTEITENCTYLQNPNFPSTYSSTSALTYTVNKCMPSN